MLNYKLEKVSRAGKVLLSWGEHKQHTEPFPSKPPHFEPYNLPLASLVLSDALERSSCLFWEVHLLKGQEGRPANVPGSQNMSSWWSLTQSRPDLFFSLGHKSQTWAVNPQVFTFLRKKRNPLDLAKMSL